MFVKEDDGRWSVTVDLKDGSPIQKYYGDTQDEVVSELVKAQEHASRTIKIQKAKLRVTAKPNQSSPRVNFEPRSLTADERYALTARLNDPSQSAEAIRFFVESEIGAPLEDIRRLLTVAQDESRSSTFKKETDDFLAAHPTFKKSQENEDAILGYLEARGYDYTAHNLSLAFEDLKDIIELNAVPVQVAPAPGRPRQAATGIPARSNVRATPTPKVAFTAEEINRLSPEEYRRKLSDPAFVEAVNKLG